MSKHKIHTLKINDDKYEYLDIGRGNVIFAFHGMGATKESFSRFVKDLSKSNRLIIADLPGHQNIPLGNFKKIQNYTEYFEKFINHFNFDKFGILGFSFGGNIARSISNKIFEGQHLTIPTVIWAAPLTKSMLKSQPRRIFRIARLINPKYYKIFSKSDMFWKFLYMIGIKLNKSDREALKKTDIKVLQCGMKLLIDEKLQNNYPHQLYLYDNNDIFVSVPNNDVKNVLIVNGGCHFGNKKAQDKSIRAVLKFFKQYGL